MQMNQRQTHSNTLQWQVSAPERDYRVSLCPLSCQTSEFMHWKREIQISVYPVEVDNLIMSYIKEI